MLYISQWISTLAFKTRRDEKNWDLTVRDVGPNFWHPAWHWADFCSTPSLKQLTLQKGRLMQHPEMRTQPLKPFEASILITNLGVSSKLRTPQDWKIFVFWFQYSQTLQETLTYDASRVCPALLQPSESLWRSQCAGDTTSSGVWPSWHPAATCHHFQQIFSPKITTHGPVPADFLETNHQKSLSAKSYCLW